MTAASISKGRIRSSMRYAALSLFALWAALAPPAAHAQSVLRDRIVDPVDNSRFSVLSGNLHPAARSEFDTGALSPSTKLTGVTMYFSRTPDQAAALQTLLGEMQDRTSPNYQRWLSPEEFADRFGLSQIDVDKIVAWLQSQGLTIQNVSRSRNWVTFSGSAQQVQAALRTELHHYAVNGETHFAMSREPSLPSALAGVVLGFRGLDDFRLKPHAVKTVQTRFTSGQTGNHFLAPGDLAKIYNLPTNVDGTGQTLAVAGQTAINVSDVDTFRSLSGLSVNHPQVTLVPQSFTGDTDPGMVAGDIDEANLDLDWAGAVARNATIKYVYSLNVVDAAAYIIDGQAQPIAPVLSISYGRCEGGTSGITLAQANALASIMQQGNAEGITIVAPAGDNGAADCDSNLPAQQGLAVDLPGALPYVTSVGGTSFSGDLTLPSVYWTGSLGNEVLNSAVSYISETSWNDTSAANGLSATGGGSSIYFPKPSWQTGTGVPSDGARDVPDISFNAASAHDPYIACSEDQTSTSPSTFEPTCESGFRRVRSDPTLNGSIALFGGTSAGVPIFAGIVTLLNQQANTPMGQGNVNPRLYALAASSSGASSFHDITTGNNSVPFQAANLPACTPAAVSLGYIAGTGYDRVTGLGSINAANLVNNWTSVAAPAPGANVSADFQLSFNPVALTVKRGSCGSVSVVLTRPNGFAGAPVLTCSIAAPLTAATCSVSPVASSTAPILEKDPTVRWWPIALVIVAICFCLMALFHPRRSTRGEPAFGWRAWAPGLALTCLLALAIGCGGSGGSSSSSNPSSPTPTSSYVIIVDAPVSSAVGSATVTVTGMIGGVSRSAQMTLAVN